MSTRSQQRLGASSLVLLGIAFIVAVSISNQVFRGWKIDLTENKLYTLSAGTKNLLAGIYLGRTIVASAFILTPVTPETVILFSLAMGSLWLATIPLTSGLVGQLYGLRYMGTLYGIVFFSHQLGSFLGVWLGGRLYDIYGDYTLVWWVGIGVGAFSALVHLPIREKPVAQPA
jgi:MFS family permease